MNVSRSGDHLVLRDRPLAIWALAGLLLVGAAMAVLLPLGVADTDALLAPWQRYTSLTIGVAGGAGTLWWLAANRTTRVDIDLRTRWMKIVRVGVTGRSVRQVKLDDIEHVGVERGVDSDGDPVSRPLIRLRNSEDVLLSELWSHDREAVAASVAAVRELVRRV